MKTKAKSKGGAAAEVMLPPAVSGLLSKRQVCQALGGISLRTLSERISTGDFPGPDVTAFGVKLPRWSVESVNRWVRVQRGEGS